MDITIWKVIKEIERRMLEQTALPKEIIPTQKDMEKGLRSDAEHLIHPAVRPEDPIGLSKDDDRTMLATQAPKGR